MSVYGTAQCEMNDIERLAWAIEMAGLGDRVEVYPQGNGIYRKYSGQPRCEGGYIRGKDAHLVIHGGLDNSGKYSTNPNVGGSGDTAFIVQPDGSVRVEIDTNWNNAPLNWELIQNYYQLRDPMKRAKAMGCRIELTVDQETGKITGKMIQERPTASRTPVRRTVSRPKAVRT